jgi:FtsZ-binding cell division protein ZapB
VVCAPSKDSTGRYIPSAIMPIELPAADQTEALEGALRKISGLEVALKQARDTIKGIQVSVDGLQKGQKDVEGISKQTQRQLDLIDGHRQRRRRQGTDGSVFEDGTESIAGPSRFSRAVTEMDEENDLEGEGGSDGDNEPLKGYITVDSLFGILQHDLPLLPLRTMPNGSTQHP